MGSFASSGVIAPCGHWPRNNAVEALPESVGQLQNLLYLDLRANRLRELPDSLATLPNLRKLDLRWTRLRKPPGWFADLEVRGCAIYW